MTGQISLNSEINAAVGTALSLPSPRLIKKLTRYLQLIQHYLQSMSEESLNALSILAKINPLRNLQNIDKTWTDLSKSIDDLSDRNNHQAEKFAILNLKISSVFSSFSESKINNIS